MEEDDFERRRIDRICNPPIIMTSEEAERLLADQAAAVMYGYDAEARVRDLRESILGKEAVRPKFLGLSQVLKEQ